MNRFGTFVLVVAALAFSGCGERGDKALAYGDGLGREWHEPASSGHMRITVDNSFTRDVWIEAEGGGHHFELTVGPIRERYMVVPIAAYEIKAFTKERSTGMTKLEIVPDDIPAGTKGLRVNIRP